MFKSIKITKRITITFEQTHFFNAKDIITRVNSLT